MSLDRITTVDNHHEFQRSFYFGEALERGYTAAFNDNYGIGEVDALNLDLGLNALVVVGDQDEDCDYVFEHKDGLIWVRLIGGYAYTYAMAADVETAIRLCNEIKELLPKPVEVDNVVPINFWHLGGNGPDSTQRRIDVPRWPEIRTNYADETCTVLDPLMDLRPTDLNGQLILWRGEPGTGKTYALRALIQRWQDCCDVHFIVDPETFFGKASYMMHVLIKGSHTDRYKLLILEDSGELLSADAKERTGQGMSRLLNAVDGILGQGLKLLILVTTNEELKSLHPAVSRDGRCAALCEFLALEPEKAATWLKDHDLKAAEPRHRTLSELYALTKPKALLPEVQRRRPGFVTNDLKSVA